MFGSHNYMYLAIFSRVSGVVNQWTDYITLYTHACIYMYYTKHIKECHIFSIKLIFINLNWEIG